MIVNGQSLLGSFPIKNMIDHKVREHGVSYGLSEAGYDIRIKQKILFKPNYVFDEDRERPWIRGSAASKWKEPDGSLFGQVNKGNFIIASAIEEFDMPTNLVGIVHDKSTWARKGLSVFNTVIEPGWKGFLTLELVYHGDEELIIPAGAGIAQVVFHRTSDAMEYTGKYQNQEDAPVYARS